MVSDRVGAIISDYMAHFLVTVKYIGKMVILLQGLKKEEERKQEKKKQVKSQKRMEDLVIGNPNITLMKTCTQSYQQC